MRWSLLFSLFTVLALTSIIEGVFATPLNVVLESRGKSAKSNKITGHGSSKKGGSSYHNTARQTNALTIKSKPLKAAFLKQSGYRNAALRSSTFTKSKGKVIKITTPKAPPEGKHADHILEAQTVAKALRKAGYKTTGKIGAQALHAVKNTLNHHDNLAFVDADVNMAKGRAQRTALSGKTPHASSHVKDYMQKTAKAGKDTAKKIDTVLRKHGVTGVSVQNEHLAVLKKMKIKRELSQEELD